MGLYRCHYKSLARATNGPALNNTQGQNMPTGAHGLTYKKKKKMQKKKKKFFVLQMVASEQTYIRPFMKKKSN